MIWRVMLLLVAFIVMLTVPVACGDDEVDLTPPEIRYGEDISEMGMFVVDPRYTVAALPAETNKWLLFDDIGELFKYREAHASDEFQVMWVNDYQSEEWLEAEHAWYVESRELNTPMGWGIAAFREKSAAEAMQQDIGGEVLAWDDVENRSWPAPPGPEAPHEADPVDHVTPEDHSTH
jgi:copper chaperone NosL